MPIVDHMAVLTVGARPTARERHEVRGTNEQIESIIVELYPQSMTHEARGHGVEHSLKGEAARGRYHR